MQKTFASILLVCLALLGALGAAGTRIDFVGGTTGATDNAVLRADGTGGLTAQSSACSISDNGCLTATGATITASEPVLNATQTWNAAGTTFTGAKLNVTDTASASGSLLADFQVGGSSKLSFTKAGNITFGTAGSGAAPSLQFPGSTVLYGSSTTLWLRCGASNYIGMSSSATDGLLLIGSASDAAVMRSSAGNLSVASGSSTAYCTLGQSGFSGGQTKALTESAATAFVQVAVASGAHVGGRIHYTIIANDGSNYQTRTGLVNFAAVNVGGTEVVGLGTVINEAVAVNIGTLTVTIDTDTSPTNAVNFRANAVSSLTQTTLTIRYWVEIDGAAVTVTPQ